MLKNDEGRSWESAAQFRAGASGTLNLATAVPVSGSYHVADAAGLLWSLHPAFASNPATQFNAPAKGFSVRRRVLTGGRSAAAATLFRRTAAVSSVQTVRRDGFASTLFVPSKARPGAPAVVVIGGSEGGEDTPTAQALAQVPIRLALHAGTLIRWAIIRRCTSGQADAMRSI